MDGHVDERVVRERWPEVPNRSSGNKSLLSVEKARRSLGYEPIRNGRCFPFTLV